MSFLYNLCISFLPDNKTRVFQFGPGKVHTLFTTHARTKPQCQLDMYQHVVWCTCTVKSCTTIRMRFHGRKKNSQFKPSKLDT